MTLATTELLAGPFTGTGADASLPFTFKCLNATDLQVLRDGVALSSDIIVTRNLDQEANPGGSVKIQSWSNTLGAKFYIYSNAPYSQPTSLPSQSSWSAKTVERALDRLAILTKQLVSSVNRAIIAPIGETLLPLPTAAARAGKFLGFDGIGQFIPLSGTGADSALRTDLVAASGASLVSTTLGSITRTLASIFLTNIPRTPFDYGAVGNGSTNDNAALQSWLDSGGSLRIPRAKYYSANTLILRKNATIDGENYGFDNRIVDGSATQGYDNQPGSRILFAAGKGFEAQPQTAQTDETATIVVSQEGAFNSVIRNLALVGAGTGAAVAGLYCRTLIHLDNVHCYKFQGKGFDISAALGPGADPYAEYGNASQSKLRDCQAIGNGSHGFHTRGADANVVTLDGCNASSNGGWGFLDESYFGNIYNGCHASANSAGSYKNVFGVSDSAFNGCYVEPGTGQAPDISYRCTVNGGQLASMARGFNTGTHGHPAIVGPAGLTTGLLKFHAEEYTGSVGGAIADTAYIYRHPDRGLVLQGSVIPGGTYDVSLVNHLDQVIIGVRAGTPDILVAGRVISEGGNVYLGALAPAINDAAATASASPTLAEFNALVAKFNLLLSYIRSGSAYHGFLAT